MRVALKEARAHLGELLERAESGAVVEISKRGKVVAKIIGVSKKKRKRLPSLAKLRARIKAAGKPLSEIVIEDREERF